MNDLAGVISEDGSFVDLWRAPAPEFDPASGQLRNNEWVSALRPIARLRLARPRRTGCSLLNLFPPGDQTTPLGLEDPFYGRTATARATRC